MIKKYLNYSLFFAVYGLCCGVYFRELTKFNNYSAPTMLGMAHAHVLMLGFLGFIIISLLVKVFNIGENKKLSFATTIYIVGIMVASITMIIRGTLEVLNFNISLGFNTVISVIAGIGHVAVAAGIIRILNVFRKAEDIEGDQHE